MRAVNKGEVPLLIIDKIFGLFWKSQLNTILKAFLSEFKPSKNFTLNPKTVFEKFIDDMYFGVQQFIQDKSMLVLAYEKIKGVFALILENEWDKAWVLFEKSLRNYEFIYRIEINLMLSAECCCYLGAIEFGERRRQIEKWIT